MKKEKYRDAKKFDNIKNPISHRAYFRNVFNLSIFISPKF